MSIVSLVRHGQANTGAADEHSYDKLSDLGHQQARWLGDYLAGSSNGVTRIICGTMRRQRETAAGIAAALDLTVAEDVRLNEINYFALSDSLKDRHAIGLPNSREGFLDHLPQVMLAWSEGRITSPEESFADYEARVHDMLSEAEAHPGTMLVTSGGIIGMAMRHVLGLDLDAFSHILLQTHNSSLHRYEVEFGQRRLMTFNATPHLDAKGREAARTYV